VKVSITGVAVALLLITKNHLYFYLAAGRNISSGR
jgi:hypothetical protein